MKVKATSDRAKTAEQMVFELLVTDQPERTTSHDPQSKFWSWADRMGIGVGRFPEREKMPAPDRSHVAMAVNLDACIHCNLCVRACREVQVNDVIGMVGMADKQQRQEREVPAAAKFRNYFELDCFAPISAKTRRDVV